jgi:hypothetical protein
MRAVASVAWYVFYPATYALLQAGAWLAALIRRRHPLAPILVLAWLPIRVIGILAYWTCAEIEVTLR